LAYLGIICLIRRAVQKTIHSAGIIGTAKKNHVTKGH
jgi:hypothetical protein